jgi:hypothetical protein
MMQKIPLVCDPLHSTRIPEQLKMPLSNVREQPYSAIFQIPSAAALT